MGHAALPRVILEPAALVCWSLCRLLMLLPLPAPALASFARRSLHTTAIRQVVPAPQP